MPTSDPDKAFLILFVRLVLAPWPPAAPFTAVIQAGGRPRRLPRLAAIRCKVTMARSTVSRCVRSSAEHLVDVHYLVGYLQKGHSTSMAQNQRLPSKPGPTLAAKYVRMSTEHQQYSIDNQADAISRYAREHNMEIVRTYVDSGKSGLTIQHRPGLRQLIADVEGGSAGYAAILVYDVSRWGRFQDVDESAFYEYQCRRAKIALHYCAESFSNDGSALAALVKTLKRTMAAEYSRELSAKTFAGKSRLTELGFRQGGMAGYGFRRLLLDENGNPKFVLLFVRTKAVGRIREHESTDPKEKSGREGEAFSIFRSRKAGAK